MPFAISSGRPGAPDRVRRATDLVGIASDALHRADETLRRDRPDRDAVHADAARRPRARERLGEVVDARLGRAVRRDVRQAELARARRDVHDRAAAPLEHRLARGDRQHEHAAQVEVDHVLPLVDRPLLERQRPAPARVVDEDVEPPRSATVRSTSASHWSASRTSVGTTRQRDRRASSSPATRSRFSILRLAITTSAPYSAEHVGGRPPDSGAAARDHRDAPVEIEDAPVHAGQV